MSAPGRSAVGLVATVATVLGLGTAAFAAGVRPELARLTAGPSVEAPQRKGAEPQDLRTSGTLWAEELPEPRQSDRASGALERVTANGRPPSVSASAPPTRTATGGQQARCAQGPRQREVEAVLASLGSYGRVVVDGRQSSDDCGAIVRLQRRFGLQPVNGTADAQTANVAARIAASLSPTRRAECRPGPGLTACIDLTLQTVWVVQDGQLVFGPTVTRSGFRGYATPAGTFTIDRRARREWSSPCGVWLPYWQHFIDGIGFHQTTTYLHDAARGSHGCINLLPEDAVKLWEQLRVGATVRVFGTHHACRFGP